MSKLFNISWVFILFLLILQTFAGSVKGDAFESVKHYESINKNISIEKEFQDKLSGPEVLEVSDALVSPSSVFQFSFVEVLYYFLTFAFAFFAIAKVWEIVSFFIRSYFKVLFSSLILINAP